ncbi:MAG: 2Fe-2S iron-sulfur cluster-binding protein [Planctomycetota bacterium]|nr:2Fe-2S iron-sulfur cluster-binding protein [Planctomycetota bacterium]
MPKLTIDGKPVEIESGRTVLEAAQKVGIRIPTLCYHKEVSAYGACRICIVEVTRGKKTRLVTSCLYPAEEGITVTTNSARVLKNRKMIIELLLARCPGSAVLKNLAKEYGVGEPRFSKKNEKCILCGLCVRVCNEIVGADAIGFGLRGTTKRIATAFEKPPESCIGCGACTYVCPTGAIQMESVAREQWRDKLAAGGRECRYSRMGLISHKICPRSFDCHKCDVDQRMEIVLKTHPILASKPAAVKQPVQLGEFSIVPDLLYSRAHMWTRLVADDGAAAGPSPARTEQRKSQPGQGQGEEPGPAGTEQRYAKVGIDDFAAAFLGEAHSVKLPPVGTSFKRGEPFAEIFVGKRSLRLPAPATGRIVDVNPMVSAVPGLATGDPYGQGWLFIVETPEIAKEMKNLLPREAALGLVRKHSEMLHERATAGLGVTITDGGGNLVRNLPEVLSDSDWNHLTREFFGGM